MFHALNGLPRPLKRPLIGWYLAHRNVRFDDPPEFSGRWPAIRNRGRMQVGCGCRFRSLRLHHFISIHATGELVIGDQVFLNDGINICATQAVRIGDHAKIGDLVYIYDTHFHPLSPEAPTRQSPVFIGRNVWIGAKATLLPGSVIGNHSVIGAAAVVTGEIPAKSLAIGCPARVIRTLNVPDDWIPP